MPLRMQIIIGKYVSGIFLICAVMTGWKRSNLVRIVLMEYVLVAGMACQGSYELFSEIAVSRYSVPRKSAALVKSSPSYEIRIPAFSGEIPPNMDSWKRLLPFYQVSLMVGVGYNIFEAQPGLAAFDTGINAVNAKILHKTHLSVHANTGCPEEATCTQFQSSHPHPTTTLSPATALVYSTQDYRQLLARNIRIVGSNSIVIAEIIGLATQASDALTADLEDGAVLVERRRSAVYENILYNYRTHKTLSSAFIAAVCELPVHYDYDTYASFLTEFGTHVVVGVQAGEISLERTLVRRQMIFEEYQNFRGRDCPTFQTDHPGPSPSLIASALLRLPPNATTRSLAGSPSFPHPLSFILRELSEIFSLDHFNDSELLCDHLQSPETVIKLRRNVKIAMVEMAVKVNTSKVTEKRPSGRSVVGACVHASPRSEAVPVPRNVEVIPAHLHNQRVCVNETCGWPEGHYGLLRVRDQTGGCPAGNALTTWITGKRYHKVQTGFIGSAETFVDVGYLSTYNEMYLNFCMKKTNQFPTVTPIGQPLIAQFEPGAYCVLRSRRGPCPDNFHSGTYFLNDVKVPINAETGELPEGESYQCHDEREEPHFCGTIYKFCCRHDGDAEIPIRFPTSRPFVLLAKTMVCQEVVGMRSRHLWLPVFSETNTIQQIYGDNLPFFTPHNSIPNLIYWHICHYVRN